MATYSHSKLSSYEQCKYRYKLRYIDKIPSPVEKSIEAHLGTCTHDALEWLYIEVKQKNRLPELDEVIQKYTDRWQEDFKPAFIIVKKDLTAQDYYNKGIKFIIDYYLKHKPFKDGTMSMEEKVWVELEKDYPHKVIGFIDRLVYNEENDEFEVHDYKTANSVPSQNKLDKDRQLALYSIAVKEKYGKDKPVLLTWHYLSHNTQVYSRRTDEQLEQLKKDIIKLIKEIEENKVWNTTKTILCNWCEYKGMCKAHGNKLPEKYRHCQSTIQFEKPKEPKTEYKSIEVRESNLDMKETKKNYPTSSKYIN